jgi:hypothetical protein
LDKVPFSVYDFFAYLASGAILLAVADYVLGYGVLTEKDLPVALGAFVVVLAYVCGQVVSHFSSFLLEQVVIGRILGRPNAVLLGARPRANILTRLFPNYFRALPPETQADVRAQAAGRHFVGEGEGLFLHVYPLVTSNPEIQARLDAFRNQYGFARNMCFALAVAAISIFVSRGVWHRPLDTRWAVCAAVAAVALFYRYLKFFRQYSYELFVRYAALPASDQQSGE